MEERLSDHNRAPASCTLDLQTLGAAPDHDPLMTLSGSRSASPQATSDCDALLNAAGRGYQMGDLLGRGGMGAVYRCEQKVLSRSLAAKVILPERDNQRTRSVFLAESVVVAHLAHPNIVPVHDLLDHPQKGPVLVMKRVRGHEWAELLQDGIAPEPVKNPQQDLRRSLDEHLDILLQVCDAITFAHSKHILHRDLKPQNVMIGSHGEVLVMDWGCAVSLEDHPPHPLIPRVSDLHGVSGTPGYLAPEMALGEHHRLSPASDVYLLAGILYYILTGRPPHRGGDTQKSGGSSHAVHAVLATASQGIVPDPALVTDGQRPCPPGLCRIALQGLHKDPKKRLASASLLAQQIRDWRHREEARQHLTRAQSLLKEVSRSSRSEHLDFVLQARAAITAAQSASPQYPLITPLSLRCYLSQAGVLLDQGAIDQASEVIEPIAEEVASSQDQRIQSIFDRLSDQLEEAQRQRKNIAVYDF